MYYWRLTTSNFITVGVGFEILVMKRIQKMTSKEMQLDGLLGEQGNAMDFEAELDAPGESQADMMLEKEEEEEPGENQEDRQLEVEVMRKDRQNPDIGG